MITFATTLLFAPNIQNGILSGIIASLSLHLYRGMRPRIAIASLHDDGTLRDAERLYDRFIDMEFYGCLQWDWEKRARSARH